MLLLNVPEVFNKTGHGLKQTFEIARDEFNLVLVCVFEWNCWGLYQNVFRILE